MHIGIRTEFRGNGIPRNFTEFCDKLRRNSGGNTEGIALDTLYGTKTSSDVPTTNSYGTKTSSHVPTANFLSTKTSSDGPKTNFDGTKTSYDFPTTIL